MTDLLPQYFKNVGVHHSCATGYSATPTVTSCAEPGLPYTLSRCTTTTTTTTTSCSQVTCGFRCLRNATVHSPTSLPNCWYIITRRLAMTWLATKMEKCFSMQSRKALSYVPSQLCNSMLRVHKDQNDQGRQSISNFPHNEASLDLE